MSDDTSKVVSQPLELSREGALVESEANITVNPGTTNTSVTAKNSAQRNKAMSFLASCFNAVDLKAHKALIVGGALTNGSNAVTNIHRFGYIGKGLTNAIAFIGGIEEASLLAASDTASGVMSSVIAEMNAVLDELKNPNIDGIPIHADKEIESQDVDVAQHLLIAESAANKQYVIDNAAPRLRTWQISGYLMSNPRLTPLAGSLIIKPDLIVQRRILQWYIDSRRPVVFKTHDNRFFRAIITHMDTSYSIQGTNALAINLTLTEFVVYDIGNGSLGLEIAQAGGAE